MRHRRRRRLLLWALLGLAAMAVWRLLRAPVAARPARTESPAATDPDARQTPSSRRGATGRPALVGVAALVVLVVGVAVALGVRDDGYAPAGLLDGAALPEPVASRLGVGAPAGLATASIWAPVLRPTPVIARPAAGAPVISRLDSTTPEGTPNLVAVTDSVASSGGGGVWVRVRLTGPSAPTLGWVPRGALGGYTAVQTHVVVDLTARTLTLIRRGRVAFRAPVGVGTPAAPTPTGEFYIRNKLTRYRSSFYGPLAFGTSARSPALTDWPAGGFVGIHGTDRPDLIPGRVSHGCIRLRNDDLMRLARLMPVGTPVTIR